MALEQRVPLNLEYSSGNCDSFWAPTFPHLKIPWTRALLFSPSKPEDFQISDVSLIPLNAPRPRSSSGSPQSLKTTDFGWFLSQRLKDPDLSCFFPGRLEDPDVFSSPLSTIKGSSAESCRPLLVPTSNTEGSRPLLVSPSKPVLCGQRYAN